MRIGYNCLAVDPSYAGGVNTYVFGLLGGFRRVRGNHEFFLFVTPRNRHLFKDYEGLPGFHIEVVHEYHAFARKALSRIGLESGIAPLYRFLTDAAYGPIARKMEALCDVIHTPTTVLFPLNCRKPTSVSVHDIQQIHYPEFFDARELRWRKVLFEWTARNATYIQASSEFIRDDWAKHFPATPRDRIFVAREGVTFSDFTTRSEETRARIAPFDLPERFLFFPAQLWHHKNHLTVLKALRKLREERGLEIPLVLTGQAYSSSKPILDFIRKNELNSVRYLGKVPFADLRALYAEATFLITAVLYESSSLCVLEAATSGTPVIASATPPNVEMSMNLEMNLFPPLDVEALADLLELLWNDPKIRRSQSLANLERVHVYSWENSARSYLEAYERHGIGDAK